MLKPVVKIQKIVCSTFWFDHFQISRQANLCYISSIYNATA